MTEIIIKPHHIRLSGNCITMARPWLIRHGWTMADLRNGRITAELLRDTGDALAAGVATVAEDEHYGRL